MQPTLLVMAAGIGERYGSLKQFDVFGTNGESIMDYSIFDAQRSGFGKIVFVVKKSFEKKIKEKISRIYHLSIPTDVVFQETDQLPPGFSPSENRIKPWGTNHAILVAKSKIHEPFAVINADDFYGKKSFNTLATSLKNIADKQGYYIMVGYPIKNTLSNNGTVARGICTINKDNFLISIVERTHIIQNTKGEIVYKNEYNQWEKLDENTLVSMNMWGFTPEYFDYSEKLFADFLLKNQNNLTSEFFISSAINQLIIDKKIKIKVLTTPSEWFGVTYLKDRALVKEKIQNLIRQGEYPKKIFT